MAALLLVGKKRSLPEAVALTARTDRGVVVCNEHPFVGRYCAIDIGDRSKTLSVNRGKPIGRTPYMEFKNHFNGTSGSWTED